jgi:glutamine synthetase
MGKKRTKKTAFPQFFFSGVAQNARRGRCSPAAAAAAPNRIANPPTRRREMNTICFAEYIWLDGHEPTQGLRSKARIVNVPHEPQVNDFPVWSFDGSSTGQAAGEDSDCLLHPVAIYADPLRQGNHYLVLCEVMYADGSPHASNHRAILRRILAEGGNEIAPWLGFEQEYTLFRNGRPHGFPTVGEARPQGPYYCGAGSENIFGRPLVEEHATACVDAGLQFYGINAEVMPGQWEFQIGYRGFADEPGDALRACDDVWVGRYLLHRLGEQHGLEVSFSNKPVKGDWNGAGMHTNFSTAYTRDPNYGIDAIHAIVNALEKHHTAHISHYGDGLADRLTGLHETCDIHTFKSGIANRGASIRIPQPVALKGFGYLEDRRPGANADPYRVAFCLLSTVCSGRPLIAAADQAVAA